MGEQVSTSAGDNGNEKGVSGDGENGGCGNAGHEKRFAEMRECKDQPLEKRTGKADAVLCKNLEYIQPDPKKKQILSAPAGDNGNEKGVSGDGENGGCDNAGHEKRFAEMRECKDQPLEKRTSKADAVLCKNLEDIQPDPKKKQILCRSDGGESIEMTGQNLKCKKQHRHIGKPECSGEQRHQKSRRERLLAAVNSAIKSPAGRDCCHPSFNACRNVGSSGRSSVRMQCCTQ